MTFVREDRTRPARRWRPRGVILFGTVTGHVRLLVTTMLVFNVGFYMVLPFLAVHLTSDLGLAAGVVGAVLGLRTFFQQGLFVVGGAVSDWLGARRAVLSGITLRVIAFGALAIADDLTTAAAAVIALGVAGALFTPGIEALVAEEARQTEPITGVTRAEVFALYAMGSELGALLGPALGSILLLGGFRVSCLVAAVVFALILAVHWRALPQHTPKGGRSAVAWGRVLRNRRFITFAVGFAGYLAIYNQMYLALPLELTRSIGSAVGTGWLFAVSALLVVLLQLPVTTFAEHRLGQRRTFLAGFGLMAAGAALPVVLPLGEVAITTWIALGGFVVLLTVGQMMVLPASRDVVARLAGEQMLATHFGVLGTAGGIAVLVVSGATGLAFDLSDAARVTGGSPWLLLAVLALACGALTSAAVGAERPRRSSG
jgi:MFS family permease